MTTPLYDDSNWICALVASSSTSKTLSSNSEFEVEDDATKAQIKKAFTKSLTPKKMNKQILSRFVELIA